MTANKSHAQDSSPPKWGAHLDVEGKAGTDRSLGEGDLFVPLLKNDDTLLFTSLRTRFDDSNSREGNFGLGIRHMHESGWNLGGIAYFDRRESEWGNYFNQVTLGGEALSTDWDFRSNAYLPQGDRVRNVDALNEASLSGASITFRGGEERSMAGFDGEIGWRMPVYEPEEPRQIRLFAGGYHFFADKVENVTGPRLRAEMTFDEVPWLWNGSRFSIGSEWQHDKPRGSQGFVSARLRIPLQFFGSDRKRLTPMERRMTDPVVRDIDIVSQSGAFGPEETVSETASGEEISILDSTSTTGADLASAVASAGQNSTVVLQGSFTNVTSKVQLQAGQTLMGSGPLTVKSPSGRTATINTGAASLSGTGTIAASETRLIQMANNSSLIGITGTNPGSGTNASAAVVIDGVSGVTIKNSTFKATASANSVAPIRIINNSSNITITGNSLSASGAIGNETVGGFIGISSSNITFSNNTVSATGGNQDSLWLINTTELTGSGNSRNGEACKTQGTVSGSISFTDGTTCP